MLKKLQFVADSPNSGHPAGDFIEVDNEASLARWLRRGCVEDVTGNGDAEPKAKRKRRTKAEIEAARAEETE